MMTVTPLLDSIQKLGNQNTGKVFVPDDPDYERLRRGFNLAIDQHPALILLAKNTQDVVTGVNFARENGLGVSIQLTGHGIQYPADDSLLIVTTALASVNVDVEARTARVGAGVRFQDVLDQSLEHGLTPLLGTSPRVGVVGYTLGGGIGWLTRRFGFAADSVRWIDVVTPDGILRHASPTENADLFWALRGGGGNFGVVTAMEFALYPISTLYGGSLTYPGELAGEALRFFRDWSIQLPDEMMTSITVVKFPPIPQMPESLRGQSRVLLRAAYSGDPVSRGEALMQPWLDWQKPLENTLREMPFRDMPSIQNDPVDPTGSFASCEMFDNLSDVAIDIIVRNNMSPESKVVFSELRLVGGALKRTDAKSSAIGNRDVAYYLVMVGFTPNSQAEAAVEAYVQRYKADLKPYVNGGVYLNFMRGSEIRERAKDAYEPVDYQRLLDVKAKYDPDNLFRFSYPLVKKAEQSKS